MRKINTTIKEGDEAIGSAWVKVKVVKNKVAPPFLQTEFDLMHDRGISREGDLLDMAIEDKIVDKSGAWINYGELRLGQGRENAKTFLRENPNLIEEISKKILDKRGMNAVGAPVAAATNVEAEKEPETPPVLEKPRRGKHAAAATNNHAPE